MTLVRQTKWQSPPSPAGPSSRLWAIAAGCPLSTVRSLGGLPWQDAECKKRFPDRILFTLCGIGVEIKEISTAFTVRQASLLLLDALLTVWGLSMYYSANSHPHKTHIWHVLKSETSFSSHSADI